MKKVKTVQSPKSKAQSQGEFRRVPLKNIVPSPFQARKTFNTPDWPEFVASVRTSGVVQPGVAREVNGHIELVCGERRFRACQELELPDMPLMVRSDMSDAEAQEIVAIENLQREGLNEIEEAQGYADWINRLTGSIGRAATDDASQREASHQPPQCKTRKEAIEYIESRIHRKRATIYERLRLTELTKDEAELLTSGKISASVASLLPTIPDAKARAEYAETLQDLADRGNSPSVRQVQEDIEDQFCKPLRETPFDQKKDYAVESSEIPNVLFVDDKLPGTLVTCHKCPLRTGNMLEQFPELKSRPNVCTNPACYKLKVAAAIALELEQAAKSGKQTMTEAEFKKRDDEFVRADEFVYALNGKNGDWTTLMGRHKPEPVIVATKDGLRTVYPKAEALEACKKNKIKFRPERKEQTPEEREKEEAALKAAKVRREQIIKDALPRLVAWLEKLKPQQVFELVEAELIHRGADWFKSKSAQERVVAHIFDRRSPTYYTGEWDKDSLKLWKSAGVDFIALEKKFLAEEAKKAKPEPKPKGGRSATRPTKKGKK